MIKRLQQFWRCHHHWYSNVTRGDVTCEGSRFHAGPHHEHADYARHH